MQGFAKDTSARQIAALLLAVGRTTRLTVEPVSGTAVQVSGFNRDDVTLIIAVETGPLRLHASAEWHGEVPAGDALETDLAVNEWNANFSWPRMQIFSSGQGRRHLACDSLLSGAAGWTVKQLKDWILHAAGGAVGMADYARNVWPSAPVSSAALRQVPGDTSALVSDELVGADLSALGDGYHLVTAELMTVTPELLAETFVGGPDWQDALVTAGEGVQHASFEWRGDKVDMTVHGGVLSVETGVVLGGSGSTGGSGGSGEISQELLAAMLARLTEKNLEPTGAALSLVNIGSDEPQWLLRALCHVPAKSGMSLAQLERYCLGGAVITRRSLAEFREEFGV